MAAAAEPKAGVNAWLAGPVLVLLGAVAAVLPLSREVFGADSLGFVLLLDALFVVLLLLGYVSRPPLGALWLIGGALLTVGAIISGSNSSIRASLVVGASLAVMVSLFPFVLVRLRQDRPRSLLLLSKWFILGQSVSALAGIGQLGGLDVGEGLIFGRATGLAGHPNTLGVMAALAILAALGVWCAGRSRTRLALVGVIVLNAFILAATGSLSAMLAALVAIVFGVIAARRVIGSVIAAILLGAAAVLGWQVLLPDQDSFLSSIGYRFSVVTGGAGGAGGAASLDVRNLTYEWAWRWINESPIVGVGMDPLNAGTFDGSTVVHNFLLRGWYQGGLPVLIWLLLLSGAVLVVAFRALHRREGIWAAAAALGVVVFALTSAFLNQPAYWLPLQFALTVACFRPHRAPSAIRQRVAGSLGVA